MQIIKKALHIWPQVFLRVLPWALLHLFVQVFLTLAQQMIPQKESLFFISWILFVFGVTLFFSLLGVIVINQSVHDLIKNQTTPLLKSLEENFKYVMIESFRAFLPVILKFCLFIIPGLIESVRLYWITYVVQFDEDYKKGQVDALQRSRELIKGNFFKAVMVLIFAGGLSMLPRLGSSSTESMTDTLILGVLIFISVGLEVLADIILYYFYWHLKEGEKNVA